MLAGAKAPSVFIHAAQERSEKRVARYRTERDGPVTNPSCGTLAFFLRPRTRVGPRITVCLKLLRKRGPLIIINCISAPPVSKALTKLPKAGFRKIEPLYFVEVPALGKPFWELTF